MTVGRRIAPQELGVGLAGRGSSPPRSGFMETGRQHGLDLRAERTRYLEVCAAAGGDPGDWGHGPPMGPDVATQRRKAMNRRFSIGPVQGQEDCGGVADPVRGAVAAGDCPTHPIVAKNAVHALGGMLGRGGLRHGQAAPDRRHAHKGLAHHRPD